MIRDSHIIFQFVYAPSMPGLTEIEGRAAGLFLTCGSVAQARLFRQRSVRVLLMTHDASRRRGAGRSSMWTRSWSDWYGVDGIFRDSDWHLLRGLILPQNLPRFLPLTATVRSPVSGQSATNNHRRRRSMGAHNLPEAPLQIRLLEFSTTMPMFS